MQQQAAKLLKDSRLRQTRQRIEVLSYLLNCRQPANHQEITASLQGLDRVTVYRVLDALMRGGIIHRLDAGDRVWRFAVCGCGHSIHCHPHFTCRSCGKTECLIGVSIPSLRGVRSGYVVENQEVYMHGLCSSCSSREKNR
jgi:Fur family transcriptional regulator, ferric uptake regulator